MLPHAAFLEQVRLALEKFQDSDWLEAHSPLATPYFLGKALHQADLTRAGERGRALQIALETAAGWLWDGPLPDNRPALLEAVNQQRAALGNTRSTRYQYLLLDLRYFRRHFPPKMEPRRTEDIYHFVGVGRGRLFEHLQEAIGGLGRGLIEQFRPTLRLETPASVPRLVGRDAAQARAWEVLERGQSVALSGTSGIGKTSLGSSLGRLWQQRGGAVFWYTFRPGLNDQLESLLFGLGHFLKEQGCPGLWSHMLTPEGETRQSHLALGFLRADLEQARPARPLLCFDEVDLLDSGEEGGEAALPVLELLDSLRGQAAVLLMGQRMVVDTELHIALTGLDSADIQHLFSSAHIPLTPTEAAWLGQRTQGAPRLLELIIALCATGRAKSSSAFL